MRVDKVRCSFICKVVINLWELINLGKLSYLNISYEFLIFWGGVVLVDRFFKRVRKMV